jgi:phage terminase small subunit
VTDRPNEKRDRFCEEYLVDLNATQAAIRAGYSPASAKTTGSRLLKDVDVKAKIDDLRKDQSKRTGVTADKVIAELAKIGFADTTKAIRIRRGKVVVQDTETLDEGTRAAISEIKQTRTQFGGTLSIKFHDKRAALHDLGLHLGIFEDDEESPDLPMPAKVVVTPKDGRKSA